MAMVKKLILVRHAKSSWKDTSLNDIQRPLNKRGSKDAPKMGDHMASEGIKPEVIFSSPGLRALTTARLISVKIEIEPSDIIINEDLYTFSRSDLINAIQSIDDGYNSIMIVGHNPAITETVNYLSGSHIENIPTCGVAVLNIDTDSWKNIYKNKAILERFDYPKKLW